MRYMRKSHDLTMIADCWTCGVLSLLSGHVFDASRLYVPDGCFFYVSHGCMCLQAVLISDSLADKPLWLDGPLLLVG